MWKPVTTCPSVSLSCSSLFASINRKPRQIARTLFKGANPLANLAAHGQSVLPQTVRGKKKKKAQRRRSGRRRGGGWLIQCCFHSHLSSHWICLPVFLAIDFQLNEPATPSTQHAHSLPTFTHHNGSMRHFSRLRAHTHTQITQKKWCKHKNKNADTRKARKRN